MIGSLEAYRQLILAESESRGVLIYANGTEYQALREEPNVIPVTPAVHYLNLETMDAKMGPRYPVYMISEDYGGRGFNFRAMHNPLGITMLVLSSFPDQISMTQTLFRVGRFGDNCRRIRDTKFTEIDEDVNAKRKGAIEALLIKVRSAKAKAAKNGKAAPRSPAEFQDQRLTNAQYLAKE